MGGGDTESQSTQRDITPGEYTQLRSDFANVFGEDIPAFRNINEGYQGAYTANITPQEQGLVDEISGYGGAQISPAQRAAQAARLATIRGENLGGTNLQPLFSQINEAFDEGTLQNVGMFTGAGHSTQDSSPFQRSEAMREKGRLDAIARVATDVHMGERGFQEAAAAGEEAQVAQRQGINAGEIQSLIDRLSATQLPRLIADMGLERGLEQFNQEIQNLMNLFGMGVQTTMPQLATDSRSKGWNMFI